LIIFGTIEPLYRLLQKLNPTQTQTPNLNRITIQIKKLKNTKIKKEKIIKKSYYYFNLDWDFLDPSLRLFHPE